MTIAPITQAEIDNVEVTRDGVTLSAAEGTIKTSVATDPSTLRTRAIYLLALANYIDNPPLPPFEFPKNHAAVITADGAMKDGKVPLARFTRIEDSGWFSRTYGWITEATILKEFTNMQVVSEGIPGLTPEDEPDVEPAPAG
ncbi:hypothetical protein SEA_LYMARA_65 [Arthrobacter phage Lymara]|uniref:Uncharacterized protein n=1 Tax=Arthrobacter phage Lymara TaxID=2599828 RepID=A0A5J6TVM1_9CAUD|nr:hypothetical protein HYQ01_gp065 [Arthrobacter phage Lymara]QFG14866.1 hypothetical protein SEA_LYMARA_65 [Arthrobacter phage Lymara]